MDKINVMDFEKKVVKQYFNDEDFFKFLEEKKELVLDYSKLALKELEDEDLDILGEESVIDYLEEIASITPNENPEGEDFIVQNLPLVASIAFNYLREGVAYLDVVQEGTMGLIKGIENYNGEKHGDFENYKKYWIIREIVLFINNKITDIKNEFKSFFKDKREKLMEKLTEFSSLKNRLSSRQIEVLNYYFGFGVERRFSIFEIEEKLGIEKGKGEIIFEQALLILSTMEGKMFL